MSFGPKAQAVIDRIAGMDLASPTIDRGIVERAIHDHLKALGVPDRPIRWFEDALAALAARDALDALAARDARDARDALAARAARDARAARAALAARDARDARAALAALDALAALAALDALAARDALDALAARDARDARDALAARDARAARAALAALYWYRFDAYYSVREAVYWIAAAESTNIEIPGLADILGTWIPFVDAYEAGLWMYWYLDDEIWVFGRPAMSVKGEQLHCEDGPAVWWPSGEKYFFLNGVEVPQEIVETPASGINPKVILKTDNAEVRREIVRKIGIERVCEGLNAKTLDSDGEYELLALNLGDGRVRPYLKMRNPSIGVFHIEGVSPECQSVQAALNFRNGLTPEMIDDENGADFIQQGDVLLFPRGATKFKSQPVQLT